MTDSFYTFLHNGSLVMLVAVPVLIAIPPRKLDLYTFSLTGAWIASFNHQVKERTGAGMLYQLPGVRPPRTLGEQVRGQVEEGHRLLDDDSTTSTNIQETLQKHGLARNSPEKGSLNETARQAWQEDSRQKPKDWKQERLAMEQQKLDEGEGYWDMIVDQIWDVWTWGQHKSEELVEKNEEVVEQRQKQKQKERREIEVQNVQPMGVTELASRRKWTEEFPEIGKVDGWGKG